MVEPRELDSVDDILDFAIKKEQEASEFYSQWSAKVSEKAVAEVLEGFAADERRHETLLTNVKTGKKMPPVQKQIANLSISDYLVEVEPSKDMDYQRTLMVAMQREKAAFRLYSDLASKSPDADVQNLLLVLAQEEAKHKLRLETIYDDEILREN
jgi:rubrerythrin